MATATFEELLKLAEENGGGADRELPEGGPYRVVVKYSKVTPTTNGEPSISVLFEGIDGEFKGATRWDNLYFTPKAAGMTVGKLKALGVVLEGAIDHEAISKSLVGQPATIEVAPQKSGKYAGKLQVSKVSKGDAPGTPNLNGPVAPAVAAPVLPGAQF